jgi:hypothetical protein
VRGKQPIDQYGNGAGEDYGTNRGHGSADGRTVWLPLDHVEKETARLS